jgi:hypothetical protein
VSDVIQLATLPQQIASRGGATYRTTSIDHDGSLHFPSGKLGFVKPEDLLWVAIDDKHSLGVRHVPSVAKASLRKLDAEQLMVQVINYETTE